MDARSRPANRRLGLTRFFVPDAAFHWYIRAVGFGSLGIAAFFGALSWWYNRRLLESLGLLDAMGDPTIEQVIADYATYSIVINAVASVGTVLFVTLLSLFLLARISGPVYRIKQHMLGIMMGRPPSAVSFRRDDQLADLSETFNEFLAHLGHIERRAQSAAAAKSEGEAEPSQLGARAES